MNALSHDDLSRLNNLLTRTGDFIAYFEVAEHKMMEWRHDIESQVSQLHGLSQEVEKKFSALDHLLSETGVSAFRDTAVKALSQGEAHLDTMEKHYAEFTNHLQQQQDELKNMTKRCIDHLEQHTNDALAQVSTQLSKYDAQHFHRIASESCDHVEKVAHNAVNKSNRLLKLFQFRFGIVTVMTSILTAFIIVLYLSDEAPWEMHQQALNEREAGKLLLQAWPNLSHTEKSKILNHRVNTSG